LIEVYLFLAGVYYQISAVESVSRLHPDLARQIIRQAEAPAVVEAVVAEANNKKNKQKNIAVVEPAPVFDNKDAQLITFGMIAFFTII